MEAAAATTTRSFYGRWAPVYDALATRTPGVGRLRRRTVAALDLEGGETVVDVGCGPGPTLPCLREAVGPEGRVVGLDLTPELLGRAATRTGRWPNVEVVQGDAATPPLSGPVDGVLASFIVGLLDDPAAAVDRWLDTLAPGGRVAILDGTSTPYRVGTVLNPLFGLFVRAGAPPRERAADPLAVLDRRVEAAHGRLLERADTGRVDRSVLGFVRLTVGCA